MRFLALVTFRSQPQSMGVRRILALAAVVLVSCSGGAGSVAGSMRDTGADAHARASGAPVVMPAPGGGFSRCYPEMIPDLLGLLSAFDRGDLAAIAARVAPASRFRTVMTPVRNAPSSDRSAVAADLRAIYRSGHRVFGGPPATEAGQSPSMGGVGVEGGTETADARGFTFVTATVQYRTDGSITIEFDCSTKLIVGFAWDRLGTG